MKTIFFDFEAKDRGLNNGIGPGWPYAGMVDVVGYCYAIDDGPILWEEGGNRLDELLSEPVTLVAHNMTYDAGILHMLGHDLRPHLLVDTELMAAYNGYRNGTRSLNAIAEYLFNDKKRKQEFVDIAIAEGWKSTSDSVMERRVMENLDIVYAKYPKVVIDYCEHDVFLLRKIHKYFERSHFNHLFFSDLTKAIIKSRAEGSLIDLEALHRSDHQVRAKLLQAEMELESFAPGENFNSPRSLGKIFTDNGYKLPTTEKGNLKTSREVLEALEGPLPEALRRYRKYDKMRSSFIDKLKFLAGTVLGVDPEFLPRSGTARIHPCLNIMKADTGRFSSDSPNVQQLSKHDPEGRELVRGLFVAEPGEQYVSLDFSAQEIRMQAMFADMLKIEGGHVLAKAMRQNPDLDTHQLVADICQISRKHAKTINLGLAYGMGNAKLIKALGLEDDKEAERILQEYHAAFPYLKNLKKFIERSLEKKGYITMLTRRKVNRQKIWIDPDTGAEVNFLYKALNILIQGNSADQTMATLVHLYRHGIKFKFAVHDEICLSTSSNLDVAKTAHIMANVVSGTVPFTSGVAYGTNFGNVEDVEEIPLTAEEMAEFEKFKSEYTAEFTYKAS